MVTTRLYTAEDLQRLATDEADYELIEGELVPMSTPTFGQGVVHGNLLFHLHRLEMQHGHGNAIGRAGFILERDPDTVLAPAAAFVASERWPEDLSGFVELAPDLAVEIVSPSNSPGEIERKVGIYLQAGVLAVWVVYPDERQVVSHTPLHAPRVFTEGDQIEGDDVLSGLLLPVADIFA